MKLYQIFLVTFFVFSVAACTHTYGRKYDEDYVSQIVKGKTTKAQIREHLGKPYRVENNFLGEAWVYEYSQSNTLDSLAVGYGLKNMEVDMHSLRIQFSGDTVSDYKYMSQ